MSIRRIWLPVFSLFAISCGGGGTSVHPATQFRGNGPGDSWSFEATIDFGVFGTFPGTLYQSIDNDNFNGSPSVRSTQVFTIQRPTGPSSLTSYAEYDLSGKLLAETMNGTLLTVATDTFSLPNTIDGSLNTSGSVTFTDGSSIDYSYKVVGAAAVSTPFGPFTCWQVSETDTQSSGTTDHFEQSVAPETGNFVILRDKTANPDGTGYTYTALLTGMTISGTPPARYLGGQMNRLIGLALRSR